VVVLVISAGCAALPPGPRFNELQVGEAEGWASSLEASAGVDPGWVDRFRDDTLKSLVDEAITGNFDLRAALARVDQAVSNVRLVGVARRPTADGTFDARRQKQNFIGFPFSGPDGSDSAGGGVSSTRVNTFGLSFDVAWELDVWGRVRAGESAEIASMQAADADFRAAQTSLAARVAKSYFALVEAHQQVALAKDTVENFRRTEKVIRERFEIGESEQGGLGADLRLAKVDVASALAQVEERYETREMVSRQLEVLLGRYPKGDISVPPRLPQLPGKPPAGLPSGLLMRRPDVLAAERRFASQGEKVKEARRAVFPRIRLTGSSGTSAEELEDILDSNFGVWSLAGNAIQPILAAGRIRGEIALRGAREREALATLQQTVLGAFSEVETALTVEQILRRREMALREAARLAQEADKQARSDYRDAVGDILTVLAAQERLLAARASLITVRRLRLDNRVDFHLALGGDFRPATNQTTIR